MKSDEGIIAWHSKAYKYEIVYNTMLQWKKLRTLWEKSKLENTVM